MKKLKNLGTVLNKKQLKETHGGFFGPTPPPVNCVCRCGTQETVCHGSCIDGSEPIFIPGSCSSDGGPGLPF